MDRDFPSFRVSPDLRTQRTRQDLVSKADTYHCLLVLLDHILNIICQADNPWVVLECIVLFSVSVEIFMV